MSGFFGLFDWQGLSSGQMGCGFFERGVSDEHGNQKAAQVVPSREIPTISQYIYYTV